MFTSEVESSRTSLASRTHFEVFGLGLEASSPQKLPWSWFEDSTIFCILKILQIAWKKIWRPLYCGDRLTNFFEDLFFGEPLRLCPLSLASSIPVFGLKKGCFWPWPWIFFVSLALVLASSLVSSTPPLAYMILFQYRKLSVHNGQILCCKSVFLQKAH